MMIIAKTEGKVLISNRMLSPRFTSSCFIERAPREPVKFLGLIAPRLIRLGVIGQSKGVSIS